MNWNERYFSLLAYNPQVTVWKVLFVLMNKYFWHTIQMPKTRHMWGQIHYRGSPAQVRHCTPMLFRARLLVWSPVWGSGSLDHAWGGTGCPEGQALKPCPSWGPGINQLEPWMVGSCSKFSPSSRAQLSRPALLKCICLCFILQTFGVRALAQEVTDRNSSPSSVREDPKCYPQEGNQTQGAPKLQPAFQLNICLFLKTIYPWKEHSSRKHLALGFVLGGWTSSESSLA